MIFTQTDLTGEVLGVLLKPAEPTGLGLIVITGSSGRVDVERAALFASRGATVLAQQWWGGEGQAKGINLIALEVLSHGIDRLLVEGCERIAVLGVSYGAQAVLSIAARDQRVQTVIAISPSQVVWQNSGPGLDRSEWPPRSSFTWRGEAVPCVMLDPRAWPPFGTRNPEYRALHEASLRTFADDAETATIRVEDAAAEIILVAGGADALWPSDTAARAIADRLARFGKRAVLIEHPHAGHSPVFPGETQRPAPAERAWGGTPDADRELGAAAFVEILNRLGLE